MRCRAYCVNESYDLKRLHDFWKGRYTCRLLSDALLVEPDEEGSERLVIVFQYGAIIFWDVKKEEHSVWMAEADPYSRGNSCYQSEDYFDFSYGDVTHISHRQLILPNRDVLVRLAVSHAMAQSGKLEVFEVSVQQTIDQTQEIPYCLASEGKIALSQRDLRRMLGSLYIQRSSINLHFDLLDEPDFFWDHDELCPIYEMMATYLDIQDRIGILNQKLAVVHELYQMLNEELAHKHSSRLEWIIILLIGFEICLTLHKEFFSF